MKLKSISPRKIGGPNKRIDSTVSAEKN